MKWEKKGLIYKPESASKYLVTHAANPTAIALNESKSLYRIFFNGRDINNKSSVGYFDYDFQENQIIKSSTKFLLRFGDKNSFYSHGISLGNFWEFKNQIHFGFMAWQIRNNDHWRGDIGVFKLNKNCDKVISDPSLLMGISSEDKVSLSYPYILFDEKDLTYKMLYGSTKTWDAGNGEMIHTIKLATTNDFKSWKYYGTVLEYNIGIRQAFSRPTVIKINDEFYCWFSYRSGDGSKYKIGCAKSKDFLIWEYTDLRIEKSRSGWDSEMVCYPYVFKIKNDVFMLYNGNNFGKTGIGLAKLNSV